MLIYHPAFDASHCSYRILKILSKISLDKSIEKDRIKIIDFYMVFPKQMRSIRFPQNLGARKIRSELDKINDSYRPCRSPFLIQQKMSIIQDKVLNSLVTNEYLSYISSKNEYTQGSKFSHLALSNSLFSNFINKDLENLILDFFINCPLNGKDGLKDRTALMEFRYDNKL